MSQIESIDFNQDRDQNIQRIFKLNDKRESFVTYFSYLLFGIVCLFPFSAMITQTQVFFIIKVFRILNPIQS